MCQLLVDAHCKIAIEILIWRARAIVVAAEHEPTGHSEVSVRLHITIWALLDHSTKFLLPFNLGAYFTNLPWCVRVAASHRHRAINDSYSRL